MKQIIVTTDLSANSKAGMRFAIQLAQLSGAELIFLLVHFVLPDAFWSEETYEHHILAKHDMLMKELAPLVKAVYRSMKITPENYTLAVHHNIDTVKGIIEYTGTQNSACICISTRGAGTLKKITGTNTSKLIAASTIPVLCVPCDYRVKPVTQILYASDMANYETELQQVISFARPLKAHVQMLHFYYPGEFRTDTALMQQTLYKEVHYKIDVHLQERDSSLTLLEEISTAIETYGASVLVMFTHKDQSLFDRIILPAKTKEYSFHGKIPLLSFSKAKKQEPKPLGVVTVKAG